DAARPKERDEGLAFAEVIVIAHRHEDAVPGLERADHVGHVFVEIGAARHHVARHDGEIGRARVGRARPAQAPRPGRHRADVEVGELRDPQAVEAPIEAGNAHVALDDAGPPPPPPSSKTGTRTVASTEGTSVQTHAHQWMKYGMSTRRTIARPRPLRSGMP